MPPKPSAPKKSRIPDRFDHTFERWTESDLQAWPHEFEQCRFVDASFADAGMQGLRFIDCVFERCNLSMARVDNAGFQNVAFRECKLTGVPFTACRDMLFEVHFDNCRLDLASFYGKKMSNTSFRGCSLSETDFTGADLTGVSFPGSTLERAIFSGTQLAGADLTSASGFVIDPAFNPMRGARFSRDGLLGLVAQYGIVVE